MSVADECVMYFKSVNPSDPPNATQDSEDATCSDPPPAQRLKGLAAVLKHIQDDIPTRSTLTPRQQIDKEINSYLNFPVVESDTDPLVWWKVESG